MPKILHRLSIQYSISITSLMFCLGMWKIRKDLKAVFSRPYSKTDAWVKIIECMEIFVFMLMIMIVTTETIADGRKHKSGTMDVVHRIRDYLQEPAGIQRCTLLHALFYSFLASVLIFRCIFGKRHLDYTRFLLFSVGQIYLLNTELNFVSVVLDVKNCYTILNRKLTDKLRGLSQPTVIWLDGQRTDFIAPIELSDFSNIHWSICKYVDYVNRTHSLRLFSIIICIFYKLTFIPYLLSLNLINAYAETLMKELINACLLCFHLAELLLLALTADSATKEAKRTRNILCEYLKFNLREENVDSIELFLTHFPVHKAEFKIFNLFTLHRPFVLSIFRAVTTYTVIFIQLQDTFNVSTFFYED